jgi:hypothetical protein
VCVAVNFIKLFLSFRNSILAASPCTSKTFRGSQFAINCMMPKRERECVIEERVCNSSARNDVLALAVKLERSTVRSGGVEIAEQLVVVTRFHIATLILVVVHEPLKSFFNSAMCFGREGSACS